MKDIGQNNQPGMQHPESYFNMLFQNANTYRWAIAIAITLGFVLIVIGTNMPNIVISSIGICLLIVIGTVYFIRARFNTNRNNDDNRIDPDDYRKDLTDTLNGYGLNDKYTKEDVDAMVDDFRQHQAAFSFDGSSAKDAGDEN